MILARGFTGVTEAILNFGPFVPGQDVLGFSIFCRSSSALDLTLAVGVALVNAPVATAAEFGVGDQLVVSGVSLVDLARGLAVPIPAAIYVPFPVRLGRLQHLAVFLLSVEGEGAMDGGVVVDAAPVSQLTLK